MKFNRIFVEKEALSSAITQKILTRYKDIEQTTINKIEDVFGQGRKPYLQKRDNLNLFVGNKKGTLVKEAPDAYGLAEGKHYYFIYAYNCIYECQYCYLQGYFDSPDIVLFVNHEDIIDEMQGIFDHHADEEVWFHAGEFSDSLALSHLTGEWPLYWPFFEKNSRAKLELRTKSTNVKALDSLKPLENVIISFSLAPGQQTKKFDLKTPSLEARLKAIEKLSRRGFQIGLHFDPIIDFEDLEEQYENLAQQVSEKIPADQLQYISLGVVRFTKDVYRQVKEHYPQSAMLAADFVSSFDNKVRYHRPIRLNLLKKVKAICEQAGIASHKIYLCMEG